MKKKIFLLLLFFTINVSSQNNPLLIEYHYKMPVPGLTTKAYLIASQDDNYFIVSVHNKGYKSYEEVFLNPSFLNPYFVYKYDKVEDIFYHKLPYIKNSSISEKLVKDKTSIIKWQITNETKIILGYKCQKASAEFRGRKWTVWFTPDIVGDVFPWKLNGLPGAILEAEESSGYFGFVAEKVVLNGNFQLIPDYKKLFEENIPLAKPYQEVIVIQNEELLIKRNERLANEAKGTIIEGVLHHREGELEKTFEWEIPKTQK